MLAFETGIHDTIGIDLVKNFMQCDFILFFNFTLLFVYGFGCLSVFYSV